MTRTARLRHRADTGVDISSIAFWSQPFAVRDLRFAELRARRPVSWHPQLETPGLDTVRREPGFWAVTTAADIAAVSRDPARFSSATGQVSVRPAPYRLEASMLVTDPPDHALFRGALAGAFSPAALRRRAPQLERAVRQAVLQAAVHRELDLVPTLAAVVPARVLALLLGVPAGETDRFVVAVDAFAGGSVPAGLAEGAVASWFAEQTGFLRGLFDELVRLRLRRPGDDLVSVLLAEARASSIWTPERLLSTLLLLVTAGHDTMKQLITLSVHALAVHEDQHAWLREDLAGRFDAAFPELLRYTSPILSFARTATTDVVLQGAEIAAGDKVALFYCSGNRDETLFDEPGRLRLDRGAAGHVAFGGGGIHFCLGSALARLELRALLAAVHDRMPTLQVGDPVYAFNDAVHRVESLPVRRPR